MSAKHQGGFTLVEIALVMVIIGLLLGGILQGKSLIREMQVKDVMTIIKDLQTSSQYFKDRYHYLPGDWVFNVNEIPNVVAGGDGNGLIVGAEVNLVQNHLVNAGFIRGDGVQISTRYGNVRVVSRATSNVPGLPASIQNVIEMANLPCDVAMEIDLKIDDGAINTGNAQASVANCVPGGVNDPVPFFAVSL
jgi:prepilin-type N-terminal cleavage/methylation domain-containing protein